MKVYENYVCLSLFKKIASLWLCKVFLAFFCKTLSEVSENCVVYQLTIIHSHIKTGST